MLDNKHTEWVSNILYIKCYLKSHETPQCFVNVDWALCTHCPRLQSMIMSLHPNNPSKNAAADGDVIVYICE